LDDTLICVGIFLVHGINDDLHALILQAHKHESAKEPVLNRFLDLLALRDNFRLECGLDVILAEHLSADGGPALLGQVDFLSDI
jgi:hypothetical protein